MTTDLPDIQLVNLKTRQVATFPGSQGLFSPRWSRDGHYLAAVTVEGSRQLMLYDFRTQKWSEWITETANVDYPAWSADSRYIYYDNFTTESPKCRRVKIGEDHPEDVFGPSGLRRFFGPWGLWSGQAPDDSRLFVRDMSTRDIYALGPRSPIRVVPEKITRDIEVLFDAAGGDFDLPLRATFRREIALFFALQST